MCYVLLAIFGLIAYQTDWMGGDGVLGPVSSWGTQYYTSNNVTVGTPGQVSLIATSWTYTNWIKHVVESNSGITITPQGLLPGDIDIIAVNGDWWEGDIYIFKNDGNQNFTSVQTLDAGATSGWRCYPQDFNNDGYPDLYSCGNYNSIFLNDGLSNPGHFTLSWQMSTFLTDGMWPTDIDQDGDVDIICGKKQDDFRFYAFLNNGSGTSFTVLDVGCGGEYYHDGGIAADIDLDGFPDIAGGERLVGWFRQNPSNPLTFTKYDIDNLGGSNWQDWCHWVYTVPLCNKCIPSIDLLITGQYAHIVYENQMLETLASLGWLESSIIELTGVAFEPCTLKYFAYNACVPYDTSLCFYWRAGLDSADIVSNSWNGPYYATTGINVVDSFALSGTGRMSQYKAEFRGSNDIAVLYEVWLTYECSGLGVAEIPVSTTHELKFVNGKILLYLPREDQLRLGIYDVAGRLVKPAFDGYLPTGTHEFEVPKRTGIYFAILKQVQDQSTTYTRTLKFIKLK